MTVVRVPQAPAFVWTVLVSAPVCAFAASNSAVSQQAVPLRDTGQKTHQLIFQVNGRTVRIVLTTGALGLVVILLLCFVLAVAALSAMLARRKTKRLQTANRRLETEISERRRSEEALRKATEMVHAVAETAPLSISPTASSPPARPWQAILSGLHFHR